MNSFILTTTAKWIVPILGIFSFFLLLRGHNWPGGGFAGGLMAGAALVLYAFASSTDYVQRKLYLNSFFLIGAGLLLAFLSGLIGLLREGAFLKGYWLDRDLLILPKLGTPLLFDLGVYVVVVGMVVLVVFPNIKASKE